jgi:hypothetical protein
MSQEVFFVCNYFGHRSFILSFSYVLGPCHSSGGNSRVPTAAARVRSQLRLCGIYG